MTVTREDLDTKYVNWFRNVRKLEEAKAESLDRFSHEPEPYEWMEQDIYEQSREIIDKWGRA